MALVTVGITAGIAASLVFARVLASYLYGTTARDPVVVAAACGILGVTAVAASYLPARRAMRIDPIRVLRTD